MSTSRFIFSGSRTLLNSAAQRSSISSVSSLNHATPQAQTQAKAAMSSQTSAPGAQTTTDWSAAQYLKFAKDRTRPSRDLLAHIDIENPRHILDIGCGPGNSTEVVAGRFPDAKVDGMDSSPAMIEKAKKALPRARFWQADLHDFTPEKGVDLIFSNAVFQWIRAEDRMPMLKRLVASLPPGGVFAMQAPVNNAEPSHASMRAVAEDGPWADLLRRLKPSLDSMQTPQEIYDELIPLCSEVDIWTTTYQHRIDSHEGIVEWVKGTGLRPFIDPLEPQDREAFLAKYLAMLKEAYPTCVDGKVLLRYPRMFVVATRA